MGQDLDLAKEILKTKCLIGLLSRKQESLERFQAYFGWSKLAKKSGVAECEERLLGWGWSNKNKHPEVDINSEAYHLIRTKNELDIKLYEYAIELFDEQGDEIDFEKLKDVQVDEEESSNSAEAKTEIDIQQYGKEFYKSVLGKG